MIMLGNFLGEKKCWNIFKIIFLFLRTW